MKCAQNVQGSWNFEPNVKTTTAAGGGGLLTKEFFHHRSRIDDDNDMTVVQCTAACADAIFCKYWRDHAQDTALLCVMCGYFVLFVLTTVHGPASIISTCQSVFK